MYNIWNGRFLSQAFFTLGEHRSVLRDTRFFEMLPYIVMDLGVLVRFQISSMRRFPSFVEESELLVLTNFDCSRGPIRILERILRSNETTAAKIAGRTDGSRVESHSLPRRRCVSQSVRLVTFVVEHVRFMRAVVGNASSLSCGMTFVMESHLLIDVRIRRTLSSDVIG